MKSLFNTRDTTELLQRLNNLQVGSKAKWGKMNVAQMLAHCALIMESATGKKRLPRKWQGYLFGKMAKTVLVGPRPYAKSTPTDKHYRVKGDRDFLLEKELLTKLIVEFSEGGPSSVTSHPHPFFGKLTPEEWSIGMYKHLDHHLQQFGV